MISEALGVVTQVLVMAILISLMLLLVCIGVLIIIHVCVVGRAFRRGFGNDNAATGSGGLGNASMSQDDIESLPSFDFKEREKGSSPVDCAVCLENFKVGDKCRLLPLCRHSFHAHCVDVWLLKAPVCPICRTSADVSVLVASVSGEASGLREGQTAESGGLSGSAFERRQGQQNAHSISDHEVEETTASHTNTNSVGAELSLNQSVTLTLR